MWGNPGDSPHLASAPVWFKTSPRPAAAQEVLPTHPPLPLPAARSPAMASQSPAHVSPATA